MNRKQVINELRQIAAEIEWSHDIGYQVTINDAIKMLSCVNGELISKSAMRKALGDALTELIAQRQPSEEIQVIVRGMNKLNEMVEHLPTAYNINNVCKGLNEAHSLLLVGCDVNNRQPYISLSEALEIVQNGGITNAEE